MKELYLKRETAGADGTRGLLITPWGGKYPSVEPRPNQGKGAIPAGRYRVVVTHSPRFKKDLPLLVNVRGFDGIRIHGGTKPEHSAGCICIPAKEVQGLTNNIKKCYDGKEDVFITIIDGIGVCNSLMPDDTLHYIA